MANKRKKPNRPASARKQGDNTPTMPAVNEQNAAQEITSTTGNAKTTAKDAKTTPKDAKTTPKDAKTTPKDAKTTAKDAKTTPKDAKVTSTTSNAKAVSTQRNGGKGPARKNAWSQKNSAAARKRRQRRQTVLYVTLAVLLIGVPTLIIVLSERNSTGEDFGEVQAALASNRTEADCTEVQNFPAAGRDHIDPNAQPGNWNSNPPTSGDHLANPLPAGLYPAEDDQRRLVHSLEHGYVAIQYKGLTDEQVGQLRELQGDYANQKLIVMPYAGLENDGMALSAWQNNQLCGEIDVEIVEAFADAFMTPGGARSTAPEPLAA